MRLYTWMIRIYFADFPNFPNIMILKFRVLYCFPSLIILVLWFLMHGRLAIQTNWKSLVCEGLDCYVILPVINSGCFQHKFLFFMLVFSLPHFWKPVLHLKSINKCQFSNSMLQNTEEFGIVCSEWPILYTFGEE